MWGESSWMIRVEMCDMLVKEVEAFDSFAIHLKFDFVEDLIRFVFPIHAVTKTKAININITSSNYNWECSKSRCRSSKNSSKTISILEKKNLTSKLSLKCWLSSARNWLIDLEIVCNLIVYLKSSKKWKSLLMNRFRRKKADWRKSI